LRVSLYSYEGKIAKEAASSPRQTNKKLAQRKLGKPFLLYIPIRSNTMYFAFPK